ncbi:MAG: aspartate kinase [Rikenellaceae bacterium]|nr:aspartate kinase [Rikenellaceae bacterium]
MRVFKFGGASVRSAEGVRNLCQIAAAEPRPLFIVVSAMGKTTNALEEVLAHCMQGDTDKALERAAEIRRYHDAIASELSARAASGAPNAVSARAVAPQDRPDARPTLNALYAGLDERIRATGPQSNYDRAYDALVSYGELLSTVIVSAYLHAQGLANRWIDMRACLITDDRFREANIDPDESAARLRAAIADASEDLFVGQGFIGATTTGQPTTLGREGSDYSAAMVANLLDAESVAIWKDVDGILNADPRRFSDTVHIPELTYLDAIELAYSGAQVIHPKTIKPLQNKGIPLYVRPFGDRSKPGSVIRAQVTQGIHIPVLILKERQTLVTIRPKDFSFVLEERLADIFSVFRSHRVKINMIQSSAVSLSLCVDDARGLHEAVETLQQDFRVMYNGHMELLTVRGYDQPIYDRYATTPDVFLVQRTRRSLRIVRRQAEELL